MSGVKVKDFMVYILVGAGLLLMLSACQTSKHAEVMSAEDLPEQAQELDQELDESAVAEDSFFEESAELQDEPAMMGETFEESAELRDEPAMMGETFEESAELQDEPAMMEETFEESAELQDEPAMLEETFEEPAELQDAMMGTAIEEPVELQDAMMGETFEESAELRDEPAMMGETFEESAELQDEPAMMEETFEEPVEFQDEPAMATDAFGETMDGFEEGGVQMMPAEPMEDSDHIEEMDTGMMSDSQRERQDGTGFGLSHVFFDYDSYEIRPDVTDVLRNNARLLKDQYQDASVLIEGHCDERGTVAYNQELGKRRAQAVKDYLVDLGVRESRIRIVSYGKERPFCMESEESCWAQNRRGHFLLQP